MGVGETFQPFIVLGTLPEDPSSDPSIHVGHLTMPAPEDPTPSCGLDELLHSHVPTHIYKQT